ncbi:glycosyltransferase family 2 protein [Adhaeribacter soli]|uniref:Glycosyltransferase n=1 Tax=Adhaeribacter soli TaxID=2607655 RepID=A0A5N1IKY1_9BACT|nr:glycosyltransferase [Adhaeribacter soli]KAA9326059.1 glycosyltransferase [Adhaeribacter soli]
MKKLAVIIVNYNVCYFLEQALLSVRKAVQHLDAEVWVVDNNSVDGSVEMVREKFPEVKLIANKVNTGFSKANNQAIRESNAEYVLLLNPDTVVEEDTFVKVCRFMDEHPEAGGLGVKMLDGKGEFLPESKRGLPTPWVAFYKIFGFSKLFPKSKRFGRYHLGFLDNDKIHEVDVLSGAFMLMRKTTLDKVGLLDEDYFMYGEDIDLSYRITQGGYRNYYFPETRIIHYKGESTKRTSVNYVFVFYRAMIIFAQKHFSSGNAGVFSFLINLAIYLRAGAAIAMRFFKAALPVLLDAVIIFIGMFFLKEYWQENHKWVPTDYPPQFMLVAVPVYILIWLGSAYFSGAYDKPFKTSRAVRGIFIGTVLIAAISNFFDAYRFSKALIVLGGAWAIAAVVGRRLLVHFLKYKNLQMGEVQQKRIAIVGSQAESRRVIALLKEAHVDASMLGFISNDASERTAGDYLGELRQLNEIIQIYGVNELIFCGKDLSTSQIISLMAQIENKEIEFKILPEASEYIIGSSSKTSQGDYYTLNIELNLDKKSNRRAKRALEICLSLGFILFSPFLLPFVKEKGGFFSNCFGVLFGNLQWVGLRHTAPETRRRQRAVLSPADRFRDTALDEATVQRLEVLYAKDYTPSLDLEVVFKAFRKLGRR